MIVLLLIASPASIFDGASEEWRKTRGGQGNSGFLDGKAFNVHTRPGAFRGLFLRPISAGHSGVGVVYSRKV